MKRRRHINVKQILMDLWDCADLLWLDLAADVFVNGMNMDYPKPFPPFKQFRNAPSTEDLRESLVQAVRSDIDSGHTIGFFSAPPFPKGFCVPTVLVPKTDGSQRICKNYSKPDINECTGAVAIRPQHFNQAISTFVDAGPNCVMLVWDVEAAYPTRIQNADHPLTQGWVPGEGYTYRLAGDFGAAVCGFRWQLFGGRLLNTIYACMATRARFCSNSKFTVVASPPAHPNRPSQASIQRNPALYTSLGVWSNQELMFSKACDRLLAHKPILTPNSRE
jgi:hypothetical protein